MRAALLALLLCLLAAPATAKQVIIFIMSDDQSQRTVSAYGPDLGGFNSTPNIDTIASGGVRYENSFVSNPVCKPSRASALTGKFGHTNGVIDNNNTTPFDIEQRTVVDLLKTAGWRTAFVGKWHLVAEPNDVGFDHYERMTNQALSNYTNPSFNLNGVSTARTGHITQLITDYALDWLGDHLADPEPLAIFVWYNAPHLPMMPAGAYTTLHADTTFPKPATFNDRMQGRALSEQIGTTARIYPELFATWQSNQYRTTFGKPLAPGAMTPEQAGEWMYQEFLKDYLRAVAKLDDGVGEILAWVTAEGLTNDASIVFTSDNGYFLGHHYLHSKGRPHEESIRVPLLIKSPGEVTAGTVDTRLALNVDLAPTILALAGVAIPPDMQGRSLIGAVPGDWRTAAYFENYPGLTIGEGEGAVPVFDAVRTVDQKLIIHRFDRFHPQDRELIDLSADPCELSDLSTAHEYHGAGGALATLSCQRHVVREELGRVTPLRGSKVYGGGIY